MRLNERDRKILHHLTKFRVLSRDQIGSIVCPEVAKPHATVNRIMKRLSLNGFALQIPRPRDEAYLYMPNPALIHTESARIRHFLAIADAYIEFEKPEIFEVEPYFDEKYRPDAYARLNVPVLIEVQRTHTSHKKMQEKVDGFVRTFREEKHDAKTLYIVSNEKWKVKAPEGYDVFQIPMKKEGIKPSSLKHEA